MADMAAARTALKTVLSGISGLNVYDKWVEGSAIQTPACLIKPTGFEDEGFDTLGKYTFDLTILVQPRFVPEAQTTLDALVDPRSSGGIRAKLDANTSLSGQVDSVNVLSFGSYGGLTVGTVDFIGAIIPVEVFV